MSDMHREGARGPVTAKGALAALSSTEHEGPFQCWNCRLEMTLSVIVRKTDLHKLRDLLKDARTLNGSPFALCIFHILMRLYVKAFRRLSSSAAGMILDKSLYSCPA